MNGIKDTAHYQMIAENVFFQNHPEATDLKTCPDICEYYAVDTLHQTTYKCRDCDETLGYNEIMYCIDVRKHSIRIIVVR